MHSRAHRPAFTGNARRPPLYWSDVEGDAFDLLAYLRRVLVRVETPIAPGTTARRRLPYLVERVAPGRWIVLDRVYKPIATPTGSVGWVDYSAFPAWHVDESALPGPTSQCWINSDSTRRWLFNDSTNPTRSAAARRVYAIRLRVLVDALRARPIAPDRVIRTRMAKL